jgi:arylsulfatase A-like enzyme
MISGNWVGEKNEAGFPGKTTQTGTAGHGTSSPYDIHNTLIAIGPDFRTRAVSEVPTANADLAPTILSLLGLPVPSSMTGRPIREALASGPAIGSIPVQHTTARAATPDGSYVITAHVSVVGTERYLDYTDVQRR